MPLPLLMTSELIAGFVAILIHNLKNQTTCMNHWDHCKSLLETQICTPFLSQHDLEMPWNQVKEEVWYVNCGTLFLLPSNVTSKKFWLRHTSFRLMTYQMPHAHICIQGNSAFYKMPNEWQVHAAQVGIWTLILYSTSAMRGQGSKLSKLPPLFFSFFQVFSFMVSNSSSLFIYVRSFMSM
jgi:hypothetical protein